MSEFFPKNSTSMGFEDLLILLGFGGILAFIHERMRPPCRYALPAIGAGVVAYVLFRDKGEKPAPPPPPPSVAESSTEEMIAETVPAHALLTA